MTAIDPDVIDDLDAEVGRRQVVLACILAVLIVGAGALAARLAMMRGYKYNSLFYEQFAQIEPPALLLSAIFAIVVLVVARSAPPAPGVREVESVEAAFTWPRWAFPALLVAVGAAIVVGFVVAFHRYYVADDEYAAWLQAHLFARGEWQVTIPAQWCSSYSAVTLATVASPTPCTWRLNFLPIHSMVRAAFLVIHADWLAGPATAALSLILLFAIARKLWPEKPHRAWISVAMLAASTQFVFMSMTMFSMPTHLLFALVWLWLYVQDRMWSIALLPVASFLALGAHSPLPHLLWVPPFILRYAFQRRWAAFLYVGAGAVIAAGFWAHVLGYDVAAAITPSLRHAAASHAIPAPAVALTNASAQLVSGSRAEFLATAMQTSLILTWGTPIAIICFLVGIMDWRSLDGVLKACVVSVLLTLAVRAFVGTQGEGFGFRFLHDGLGNIALVAAAGVDTLARRIGAARARTLVVASLLTTVVVQYPMRLWGVDRVAGPYARTYEWMMSQPAKVVVFNPGDALWARQMLRNDPSFARTPVLVSGPELPTGGLARLQQQYPGQVRVVTAAELTQFGIPRAPLYVGGIIVPR